MRVETQKVTAHLPKDLLAEVQAMTGAGVTETLRMALEKMAEQRRKDKVYEGLMSMRGAHNFSLDLNELRKDRDEA